MQNDNERININVENGVKELIIRNGQAMPLEQPVKVNVTGEINAPFIWLSRKNIDLPSCHVRVCRDDLTITLYCNEQDSKGAIITGKLEFSGAFNNLGINSGAKMSPLDLSDLIKRNRSYFDSKESAMKLVSQLRSFRAKVDKELEQSKDDRANYSIKKVQAVESNLPESFSVTVPLFKGDAPRSIQVEINIDPNTLDCSLVSPDANDFVLTEAGAAIDKVKNDIAVLAPEVPIIEV